MVGQNILGRAADKQAEMTYKDVVCDAPRGRPGPPRPPESSRMTRHQRAARQDRAAGGDAGEVLTRRQRRGPRVHAQAGLAPWISRRLGGRPKAQPAVMTAMTSPKATTARSGTGRSRSPRSRRRRARTSRRARRRGALKPGSAGAGRPAARRATSMNGRSRAEHLGLGPPERGQLLLVGALDLGRIVEAPVKRVRRAREDGARGPGAVADRDHVVELLRPGTR